MVLHGICSGLAILSCGLQVWQWLAARRFPLHRRAAAPATAPDLTLFKPLKGADEHTESCLRSWFAQEYSGKVQILFAVAAADDPVCGVVRKLLAEFPRHDAELLICPERLGPNAKVSKLAQIEARAKYATLVVSDADVKIPVDFLAHAVGPLQDERVGLSNCFYRLANPTTAAMRWEAVAINSDFWSQVLQSQSLQPLDFALGAVMITRRARLQAIGGFRALADCLADDYQLGHRIARQGHRIALCPVVVECWSGPMDWGAVWRHQLRWARTIRVCQPLPYFFSILSNATFWPALWLALQPVGPVVGFAVGAWAFRIFAALTLQQWLAKPGAAAAGTQKPSDAAQPLTVRDCWLIPLKDLLQVGVWLGAFAGNHIEWRGERYRLRRDGTLARS